MSTTFNSQKTYNEIDTLAYIDKLNLLSYLTKDLLKSAIKPNHSLTELKGLGKEIWQNQDITNYIQNERASWD